MTDIIRFERTAIAYGRNISGAGKKGRGGDDARKSEWMIKREEKGRGGQRKRLKEFKTK